MAPRDTSTGTILESIMRPALEKNGYTITTQTEIGPALGGRKHKIDVLVTTSTGIVIPISVKWQQVPGTAEEKVPFEIIKLIHAVKTSGERFPYAYLVLGGMGWSALKEFFLKDGLREYIRGYDLVRVVSLEDFITRANRKAL